MFYTECIRINSEKESFSTRILKYFEKLGTARARRELERLGYTQEYLDSLARKNSTY